MKNLCLTFISIILLASNSFSQINIIVDLPDSVYTRNILYRLDTPSVLLVNSSDENINCKLKVEYLFNDMNVAENILANTPNIQIGAEETVDMESYSQEISNIMKYHDTSFKASIMNSFLDTGKLTICYSVVSTEDTSQILSSFNYSDICVYEPTLGNLYPSNDTLIDYSFSTQVLWNSIQPTPDIHFDINYNLIVIPINEGQSDSEAFNQNLPALDTMLKPGVRTYDLKLSDLEADTPLDTIIFDTVNQITSNLLWYVVSYDRNGNSIGKNNGISAIHKLSFRLNTEPIDTIVDSLKIVSQIDIENESEDRVLEFYNYQKDLILQNQQGLLDPSQYFSYRNLDCPNGGFESNNFNGWDGAIGSFKMVGKNRVKLVMDKPGLQIGNNHKIMDRNDGNNGFDPNISGQILPIVLNGDYSARVGNWKNGGEAALLSYTFTVNQDNANFMFNYACVLEDKHKTYQRPHFIYTVYDKTDWDVILRETIIADRNDPFFEVMPGSHIVYKNWTCVPVDLNNYMGHEIEVSFLVTDCAHGGHFGYAYIDGLCENEDNQAQSFFSINTPVCISTDITADGSASTNESSHYWSIEESNANGDRINPSSEIGQWFVGQTAGIINITDLYTSLGGVWKCDQYYRIKLAVNSGCTSWDENVAVIYIYPCEIADAGPDQEICSSDPYGLVTIGVSSNNYTTGSSFQWTPTSSLVQPTYSPTVATPSFTTTYNLIVTHPNGCPSLADEVTVFVVNTPNPSITDDGKYCSRSLTVIDNANTSTTSSILWTPTNKTTESILVSPDQPTTYTVSVTNACGTVNAQVDVPKIYFTGSMSEYLYPTCIRGEELLFLDDELIMPGEYPAYNATAIRLEVAPSHNCVNPWFIANKIHVETSDSFKNTGFINRKFYWQPSTKYNYSEVFLMVLSYKNCTHLDWRDNTFHLGKCLEYKRIWWLLWTAKECVDWDPFYKEYGRDGEFSFIR